MKTSAAKAAERRKLWGYESHTPRCSNCSAFRKARLRTDAAAPADRIERAQCKKGGFDIEPHGCCDKWQSQSTGERLE